MNFVLKPWQLLLLILAGWINRHQQDAIEYLLTENQVLREKLGKGRIPLNDDQRRRLAVKGKVLSRKTLNELARIRPARYAPALAPRTHRTQVGSFDYSAINRSTTSPAADRRLGASLRTREPNLGL